MFDFERLDIYQYIKNQNIKVLKFLSENNNIDYVLKDGWVKVSISSVTNLTEGTARILNEEKKHFFTLSRGNIFECVALLQTIYESEFISEEEYKDFYEKYEQISKMLLGLYRSKDDRSKTY